MITLARHNIIMNTKQITRLRFLSTIFAVTALLVFPGCKRTSNENAGQPRSQGNSLRFAQIPISYSAVTHIAERKGYFTSDALAFSSFSVPAGPDVVTALKGTASAAADCGGIAVTPVITMIAAGDRPVVVATTLVSNHQAKLVTFADTGINENPVSLKGKRIGVVKNTNGDIYLSRLLQKGGLTRSDVVLVNGRPPDLRNLLLQGAIDAAVIWDPFIVQAQREYRKLIAENKAKSRGEVFVFVDPTVHTLAFNIVATRATCEKKRTELIEFLKGTVKAEQFIREQPEEAQRLLEEWLSLETGDLNDLMATTEFRIHLNVSQMKQWMKEELTWLKESQPDTQIPDDLSPFVDASFLKALEPDRVQE